MNEVALPCVSHRNDFERLPRGEVGRRQRTFAVRWERLAIAWQARSSASHPLARASAVCGKKATILAARIEAAQREVDLRQKNP